MATRNNRGTLVRQSWDFYESADCIAATNYVVNNGMLAAYATLKNTAQPGDSFDIYRADASITAAQITTWFALPPGDTSSTSLGTNNPPFRIDPSQGAPPGVMRGINGVPSVGLVPVMINNDGATHQTLSLPSGGPFLTLQPGWEFGIFIPGAPVGVALNLTVWYMVIADSIRPAQ